MQRLAKKHIHTTTPLAVGCLLQFIADFSVRIHKLKQNGIK